MLDIDGVILPTRERDPWGHFSVRDWDMERRMIDEQMRSRVVRLFRLGEVVWCSAWNERSGELAQSLFLPRGDFLPTSIEENRWARELRLPRSRWSWKLHSVIESDDNISPLVWIDDNIEEDALAWQAEREGPTLLIKTEESVGLTDRHTEQVADFLS